MIQGAFLNISFETQLIKVNKCGKLIDISKDNNFNESFEQFGGLEVSSKILQLLNN